MDQMQPAPSQSHFDRTASQSELCELSPCHNAVLPFGEDHNCPIGGVRPPLTVYVTVNGGTVCHAADSEGSTRADGALNVKKCAQKRGSSPPVPPLALIP
jgi:hypothetical protein